MNTKFDFRKAPKGWKFPFQKKEIRSFIGEIKANFETVLFKGTTKPSEFLEETLWCWFGVLKSKKINEEWYFSLEVSCLKEEHTDPWKDEIVKQVFAEMKHWIKKKKNLPPTAPNKPNSLFLKYQITNGNCISSCFESDLDV